MKQGRPSYDIVAKKREPIAHAASESAAAQLGMATNYKKHPIYEGRGLEAPRDRSVDTHKSGSQGRH